MNVSSVAVSARALVARMMYSPILVNVVIIRRCNLSCGYCNEYDDKSKPVPVEIIEERLAKLRDLGTFGMCITGGEPTMHPDLPRIVRRCRELGYVRTGMISNGMLMKPELIRELNDAGLQELQISIDGVKANETTQKVLDNLDKRLGWLQKHARFNVTVSGVIGACPPEEAYAVAEHANRLGFSPRISIVHDSTGGLSLSAEERRVFDRITDKIPKTWMDLTNFRDQLIRDGRAPFKCRAGSRYLYVDEAGIVTWCSQTRDGWKKPLADFTVDDLREQFYTYKSCQDTCTIGCVRQASQLDNWRAQDRP